MSLQDETVEQNGQFWDSYQSWELAENAWDESSKIAQRQHSLRVLKELPQVPGITKETKKNLKWKSLFWILKKDSNFRLLKHIMRHPFRHGYNYVASLFQKESYIRDDDLFLYGLRSVDEMKQAMQDEKSVLIVGFSYCEKPHECPSGRFNDQCIRSRSSSVCRQCFIGKSLHTLPKVDTIPLIIPTIHYIGEKIFEVIEQYKDRNVLFLITACEMTLQMFGDWGNMAGVKGIGVRLDGRICNTMKSFALSEEGIKPGLTIVLPKTEKRILDLLAWWRSNKKEKIFK